MRVAMLGPLGLWDAADREIEVGGVRLRMLLVRLALDAGRIVPSESLIDGLWGEQPPADATNALQSLVSRLRKTGMGQALQSHPVGYSLAVTDVDAHTFERLAAEGGDLLRKDHITRAAEVLREALDLWRGPALVDVADAPFAAPAVARLTELRLTALEDRIDADIRRGREGDVIVELYALAREHPLRERLAGLLIRALHLAGRQADALTAFETIRTNLRDELGVDPSQDLKAVHLEVLRDQPKRPPKVPAQLTSFVGRHDELVELTKMDGRLVTLVGPGGAGKTRLATEAAAKVHERVWFVPLAGLREASDVPLALASELGLGDPRVAEGRRIWHGSAGDVTERLVDALGDRADLIVLDNCEHLISAAAHLVDVLLAGCPRLRVMATSREPLAITGETLLQVGPLDLPEENATPEQAQERAAVRLFLDRAAAVRPGFVMDDSNVKDIVAICRQLDGLPLALELAAARLRSMTIGQVADRLDDRFRLLTGGSRTSLPRHQTLGAVVEWSWSLLTDSERTLATRLSVFASAATLEAITAVCAGGDLPSGDVLYVLASLVEKSLVEAGEGPDGPPRYRMLQTVRAYAAERLDEPREIRTRLAAYMLAFVEECDPKLRGPGQLQALSTMDAERDNVLEAVRTAVDNEDGDTSSRIAAAWTWFWMLRQGVFGESLSEQIMPIDRIMRLERDAPADARIMLRMLEMASGTGDPDPARLNELIELCQRVGPAARYPLLSMVEAIAHALLGDTDHAATVAFRRSLRYPDPWGRAVSVLGGALASENFGNVDRAERWFALAIRRFRTLGDRWGGMMAMNGLAGIRSVRGDLAGAMDLFVAAMGMEIELGPLPLPPMACGRLADIRYRDGDIEGAMRDLEQAVVISQEQGQQAVSIVNLCKLSQIARAHGDLPRSRKYLRQARELLTGRKDNQGDPMYAWVDTAEIPLLAAEGEPDKAMTRARSALAGIRRAFMVDYQSVAGIGESLAEVAAMAGELPEAARLLGAAAAVRGALDVGSPEIRALLDKFGDTERELLDQHRILPRDEAMALLEQSVSPAHPS
ncbi:BTAD domain-containing putative transcriptional regulator [Actinocrispum sp. NPDC049592]|uniref:BTAD domain-containing putative transcriptional regulator n=1 Tax=Actinocrispum sp. NPDC049592 TaxID=3154835 RepID=UPI00342E170A